MARPAPIVAALASGLFFALVPLAAADVAPRITGDCVNHGSRGITAERDLWTGYWRLNTVGLTVLHLSGTKARGAYSGGTLSGEVPHGLWTLRGGFAGQKPMRAETASSGRFDVKQDLGGRAFQGTWYAKDREGEEDKGVLRGTFLSGFWQGVWRTSLGEVVFAHPSAVRDKRLVRGRYPWSGGGTIRACIGGTGGRALSGTYRDKTGSGKFTIYLSADMKRFAGPYRSGNGKISGRWTGTFASGPVKR